MTSQSSRASKNPSQPAIITNTKPSRQFPNALFGEPERLKKTRISKEDFPPKIQENYVDSKQHQQATKNINQALLKKSNVDYLLEPNEKVGIIFDVRRENINNTNTSVLGRFIVSNYRFRFIENGKREHQLENFYSCSVPFGCILKVV